MEAAKSPKGNSINVTLSPLKTSTLDCGSVPSRFFKLVGVPVRSSECDGTVPLYLGDPTVVKGGTVEKSLQVDSSNMEIDVFEASNEEPFTLETFENLLLLHAEKKKDFIIARVTTVDAQDPGRFYFSYYAAHHINKVLFRTQPDKGLLHRMRAKNPLNNMVIVGDVYYYVIKAESVNVEEIRHYQASAEKQSGEVRRSSLDWVAAKLFKKSSTAKPNLFINTESRSNGRKSRLLSPECYYSNFEGSGSVRFSIWNNRMPSPQYFPGSSIFNDSSLVEFRDGSRGQLLVLMKPGTQQSYKKTVNGVSGQEAYVAQSCETSATTSANSQKALITYDEDDGSNFDTAVLKSPRESSLFQSKPTTKATKSPKLADFPLIKLESWSNGHESMTMSEWVKRRTSLAYDDQKNNINYVPLSNLGRSMSNAKRYDHSVDESSALLHANNNTEGLQAKYFEVRYYASDDDFLMKPEIRAYFNKNALDTTDSVLFSISGTVNGPVPIIPENVVQHPVLPNFLYGAVRRSLLHSAYSNIRKNLKTAKVQLALALYIIVVGFMCAFIIPKTHMAIAIALFITFAIVVLLVY